MIKLFVGRSNGPILKSYQESDSRIDTARHSKPLAEVKLTIRANTGCYYQIELPYSTSVLPFMFLFTLFLFYSSELAETLAR